jgi:hypothetical protein
MFKPLGIASEPLEIGIEFAKALLESYDHNE